MVKKVRTIEAQVVNGQVVLVPLRRVRSKMTLRFNDGTA